MTAPIHMIPRDLLDGFRTGDDASIEHGFRELFPTLAKEAAEELNDSAAAGRVVEQAFLRVLDQRAAITNADSLDLALRKAIHDSAIREKSRRAALNRFEQNEGVAARRNPRLAVTALETDQAWERIQRARHPATVPKDETANSAAAAKHRAAVHMTQAMNRRSKWTIPAIVLGLLAICAGAYGLSHIENKPGEADVMRALMSTEANTLTAGNGQMGNVTLADGSIVKLGAGSRLKVGAEFGKVVRAASLNGVAAFTVASASQPFELRANGVALSLTGGQIDVRADSLAPTLVLVRQGQASVKVPDSSWTATTGQSFIVETNGKVRAPVALEVDESLGWIDGRFIASGSVESVVTKMNRWYGADIGIGDASIAGRPAEVTGSLDSLSATMKSLEKSAGVRMVWDKGRMILFRR